MYFAQASALQAADALVPTIMSWFPADKADGLRLLFADLVDGHVPKVSLGFLVRHRGLLYPRSVIEATGICAVLSASTCALAAATCVTLVIAGATAALLAGVMTALLLGGGVLGMGAFVAAVCISCASAAFALSSVGALVSISVTWAAWNFAKRLLMAVVPSTAVPSDQLLGKAASPVLAGPAVDIYMSSVRTSHVGNAGDVTPRLYEAPSAGGTKSNVEDSPEQMFKASDKIAASAGEPDSMLDTVLADRSTPSKAASHKGMTSPKSSVTSRCSSPMHLSGVRSEATADSDSVAGSYHGGVSAASAPPAAATAASRRGKKFRNRGNAGKKQPAVPPMPLTQDQVVKLLESSFSGSQD